MTCFGGLTAGELFDLARLERARALFVRLLRGRFGDAAAGHVGERVATATFDQLMVLVDAPAQANSVADVFASSQARPTSHDLHPFLNHDSPSLYR